MFCSARLLRDDPEAISVVHHEYLSAGAGTIVSASYQATFDSFQKAGLSHANAADLKRRSVELACVARDQFAAGAASGCRFSAASIEAIDVRSWLSDECLLNRPLLAAGIGPYGAFLANGAECTGNYKRDVAGLKDVHRERWDLLADPSLI